MRARRFSVLNAVQSRTAGSRRAIPLVLSVIGVLAVLGLSLYAGATFGRVQPAGAAPLSVAPQLGLASAVATPPASKGTITIETFGYSFGRAPRGCRFVADVRNINAGTFSQRQTGLMPSVRRRVMRTAAAKRWHRVMLTKWLPQLKDGDKVAIGCSRGHHRSVTLAVVFAQDLRAQGFAVKFIHRDIKKRY